jgi:hypothetical protein
MSSSNGKALEKRRGGAPKGSQNHLTHGLAAFRNGVKRRTRRGRSLIDRRSAAGKHAVAMRDELIADQGGTDNLSVAKLALIEMIARDVYFLDECDKRIMKAIYEKTRAEATADEKKRTMLMKRHPGAIGKMYSYRSPVARNLASNLLALGLEKAPPKQKTLEEILSESTQEETEGGTSMSQYDQSERAAAQGKAASQAAKKA